MQTTPAHPMSEQMRQCIQNCVDCHNTCLEAMSYCLDRGGKYSESTRIRLLLNCAEICQTCADFMRSGSEFHGMTCAVCATVCDRCAQEYEPFGDTDLSTCTVACRRCGDSCRQMAADLANRVANMAT